MKKLALLLVLALSVVMTACEPIQEQARDTGAALQGVIVAAQAQNQQCVTNPRGNVCVLINQGVSGENALVTAIETYCGWSTTAPPTNPNAACVPVASAKAALQAAIANATALTLQIKGAL
jgi:hypothetical protein